jgi:hypothetical protein
VVGFVGNTREARLPARTQACVAHRGLRCSVFGLRSSYTQTGTVLYCTIPYRTSMATDMAPERRCTKCDTACRPGSG